MTGAELLVFIVANWEAITAILGAATTLILAIRKLYIKDKALQAVADGVERNRTQSATKDWIKNSQVSGAINKEIHKHAKIAEEKIRGILEEAGRGLK